MPDYTTISLQQDDKERFDEFKESEYNGVADSVPNRVALNRLLEVYEENEL